jgi:hypothetical protein
VLVYAVGRYSTFKYGDSGATGTVAPRDMVARGSTWRGKGAFNYISLANDLFVKWRVIATGEIKQTTAQLAGRQASTANRGYAYSVFFTYG